MENDSQNHFAKDKPNDEKGGRVAVTATVLACIALVFVTINLWGRMPQIFAEGKTARVILDCELALRPETEVPEQSRPSAQSSTPAQTQSGEHSEKTETTAETTNFPPAAANSQTSLPAIPHSRPNSSESVITTVITANPGEGYLEYGDIYIKNNTHYSPDIGKLLDSPWGKDEAPTVLIIHTHATECYTPTELDSFTVESGDRCYDKNYNIVRVGEELASELRKQGIRVIHDETLFDAESYTGAYTKSNSAVKNWLKKDPSIAVVLDLHRDALNAEGSTRYRIAVESEFGDAAQMLILTGTDANGTKHPNWQNNLSLALKLQSKLNSLCPGVMRPILLTNSSYDQETTGGSLLIEVGANGNSLSDALVSAKLLALALGDILR